MATVTFDHVTKKYGDVLAVDDLNLAIADGEFMVLVGPSGCGKTTSLRMIAGLEEISDGTLRIGDRVVNDVAAQGSRHRDGLPELRAVSAHVGPRQHGVRAEAAQGPQGRDREAGQRRGRDPRASSKLLDRKPKELSGGQRQRVALGRAIVREPAVFLMDEPLSNLDAKLRVQTRAEIARLHQRLGTTIVYVTHDQVEAMTMGTRIAVMSEGLLQQVGTPQVLYDQPVNRFVAGFIGSPSMNFIEVHVSTARATRATLEGTGRLLDPGPGPLPPVDGHVRPQAWSSASVPEHLELSEIAEAVRLVHRARRTSSSTSATRSCSTSRRPSRTSSAIVGSEHHVKPGDVLKLNLPLAKLHLFDAESGATLVPERVTAAA